MLKHKFKEHWPGYMINISQRFASGTPDSYCIDNGASCWIEFKIDNNKPTKLQSHVLRTIKENGIVTMVVMYVNKEKKYYADILYPQYLELPSYIECGDIKHLIAHIRKDIHDYYNRSCIG